MGLTHALQSLRENLRSAVLSMVGVAVAAIAILLLVSIGLGVQKDITGQIEDLGANILIVVPGKVNMNTFNPNLGGKSFLSDKAAGHVGEVQGVKRVAQWSFAGGGIIADGKEAYPIIIASSPEWFQMQKQEMAEGAPYTADTAEPSCILGSVAAEELFGDQPALGKPVEINGHTYKVAGVIQDKKAENSPFSMFSMVNVAYIPLPHVRSVQENVQVDRIIVEIDNAVEPKTLVSSVEKALGRSLTPMQYSVLTQEDLLRLVFQVLGILGTLVVGLTSIALVVGGLGIMTVMLMSVGERTSEIGIRKAIGASRKQVFRQFLWEAALIGLAGVVVGLIISVIVCEIIRNTTSIKPLVTGETVLMTFAVGLGLGCLFGVIPAIKASRMDPVVALRHD